MVDERVQRRIDRLLDQIDDAMDQRDGDLVRELAEDVLALDPGNALAETFLAAADRRLARSGDSGARTTPAAAASSHQTATPTLADRPESFSDGRYVVRRFLGEGGKKRVYLAHDELLDRDVAFALVKTEGLDDASRQRISREAQAMGRLGSHPHIVTVFDLGEHPPPATGESEQATSQHLMVSELMGGGDVEDVIGNAAGGKLPSGQAISIGIETCRGLELAHSKGIVHRDLKPGNMWLTEHGTAKQHAPHAVQQRAEQLSQTLLRGVQRGYPSVTDSSGGDVPPAPKPAWAGWWV